MALQGVGRESEAESVRFHRRGVIALRGHSGTRERVCSSFNLIGVARGHIAGKDSVGDVDHVHHIPCASFGRMNGVHGERPDQVR